MNEVHPLTAHIEALNAKSAAWVAEDPANRWAGGFVTDLAHWARYGVTTPEEFERYMVAVDVYEMTKSLHGYKTSWEGLMRATVDELRAELDRLQEDYKWQREQNQRERIARKARAARERQEHADAVKRATTRQEWNLFGAFASVGL